MNQRLPPLPFDDRSIDFTYAWSVFTHFRRDEAEAWFLDLARVLRPGGLLIVTVHSYTALLTLMTSEPHQTMMQIDAERAQILISQLKKDRYIFIPYNEEVMQLANVGTDYGNCFMDLRQSADLWKGAFETVANIPGGGVAYWQDALVLRRKPATSQVCVSEEVGMIVQQHSLEFESDVEEAIREKVNALPKHHHDSAMGKAVKKQIAIAQRTERATKLVVLLLALILLVSIPTLVKPV